MKTSLDNYLYVLMEVDVAQQFEDTLGQQYRDANPEEFIKEKIPRAKKTKPMNLKGVYVAALVAVVLIASYKIYKMYLSKAARSCSNFKGNEKQICMLSYQIKAHQKEITVLEQSLSKADTTNDPEKFRNVISQRIQKIEIRINVLDNKMRKIHESNS
mgnify:CR=1 FL=1